jgi:hypothetical protein
MRGGNKPEGNVFINCPFDPEYEGLFNALIFAVIGCGFRVRCALEADDSGKPRIEKIYEIIEACRYGIHDISRVELDHNDLPRFNMPLELGFFLGAKRYGDDSQRQKICMVQDTQKYRYQKFISDLAGMDVKAHDNLEEKVIQNVHSFLTTNTRKRTIPAKKLLLKSYSLFNTGLPTLLHQGSLDHDNLLFAELERLVIAWVKKDVSLRPDG